MFFAFSLTVSCEQIRVACLVFVYAKIGSAFSQEEAYEAKACLRQPPLGRIVHVWLASARDGGLEENRLQRLASVSLFIPKVSELRSR